MINLLHFIRCTEKAEVAAICNLHHLYLRTINLPPNCTRLTGGYPLVSKTYNSMLT
jgi:hypothetical protein